MSNQGIVKIIFNGAIWLIVLRFFIRIIGFISTGVTARVLSPEDFGLIAISMAFIEMIERVAAFGVDSALIYKKDATSKHYHAAWTFKFLISIFLACIIYATAGYAAVFYEDERLKELIQVLCFLLIMQGATNIWIIEYAKKLNYKIEFKIKSIAKITGATVVITMIFYYKSYWVLVLGMIVNQLMLLILSYCFHKSRPAFSLQGLKDLFNYSIKDLFLKWVIFLNNRADSLILAKYTSAQLVGFYSMSKELGMLITSELGAAINRSAFSGYANHTNSKKELDLSVYNTFCISNAIGFPFILGFLVLSPFIIEIWLGAAWLGIKEIVELLIFSSLFAYMKNSINPIMQATAKLKTLILLVLIRAVLLISMFVLIASLNDLVLLAKGLVLLEVIMLLVYFLVLINITGLSLIDWLNSIIRPLIGASTMFLAINQAKLFMQQFEIGTIPSILILTLLGAIIYSIIYAGLVLIFCGKHSIERELVYKYLKVLRLSKRSIA